MGKQTEKAAVVMPNDKRKAANAARIARMTARKDRNRQANETRYLDNKNRVYDLGLVPERKEKSVTKWVKKKGKMVAQTKTREYNERPSKTLRRYKRRGMIQKRVEA